MSVIIDSHQHFWHPEELAMPEFPQEVGILDRAFLPQDLAPELEKTGIDMTILVQGYPQSKECNDWLFSCADKAEFVAGVVAWVNLEKPDVIDEVLDGLEQQDKFVGLRHIVQDESAGWLLQSSVISSFEYLAKRQVCYDMLVKAGQLPDVIKLLEKVPEIKMVIDHIAKPDIVHGGSMGWKDSLKEIASGRNIYCKLSGIITEADWKSWTIEDIKPYVNDVLEAFGPNRCMYGSDWPVCLLAGSYSRVWDSISEILKGFNQRDYDMIFSENARRFYKIALP